MAGDRSIKEGEMADNAVQGLIEFYKICVDEEHYFLSEHQKRISFYMGLVSAALALTVGGFLKASAWHHFGLLSLGGLLVAAVSALAQAGTRRIYQRFLETVTTRANLESDLGLSRDRGDENAEWLIREPYTPQRHRESRIRQEGDSSKDWVDAHLAKSESYHGVTRILFSVAFWIGIALTLVAFAFAYFQGV
jgi:hypothetical protein